jgi:hypothetical protein
MTEQKKPEDNARGDYSFIAYQLDSRRSNTFLVRTFVTCELPNTLDERLKDTDFKKYFVSQIAKVYISEDEYKRQKLEASKCSYQFSSTGYIDNFQRNYARALCDRDTTVE